MKRSFLFALALFTLAASTLFPAQTRLPAPPATARSALVDINTATAEHLLELPGMGRAYVQRVIAGRPYTAKNQLVSRGILPEAAYDKIAAQIVAKRVHQDPVAKSVPKG